MSETVYRIKIMEFYLDALCLAIKNCPEAFDYDENVKDMLKKLTDYYDGGQWMRDYEADERGELPPGLKRGVLSEDAVYDLLSEVHNLRYGQ